MKNLLTLFALALALLTSGCRDWLHHPDMNPPDPPTGVRTATGDNFIELFWNENREPDLAEYNIYVSTSYNGRYELIGSNDRAYFSDNAARNGVGYYYAVTAVDFDGNESELSRDVAYDIPRPEGYDVLLANAQTAPSQAAYDFSKYAVLAFDSQDADMYFEHANGTSSMLVGTDTDIQDLGGTQSILDIGQAPSSGWSPTHSVRLYVGHTYAVWTWDDHYAKFRVSALSPGRVVFDWAYQLIPSNPLLKRAPAAARTEGRAAR